MCARNSSSSKRRIWRGKKEKKQLMWKMVQKAKKNFLKFLLCFLKNNFRNLNRFSDHSFVPSASEWADVKTYFSSLTVCSLQQLQQQQRCVRREGYNVEYSESVCDEGITHILSLLSYTLYLLRDINFLFVPTTNTANCVLVPSWCSKMKRKK